MVRDGLETLAKEKCVSNITLCRTHHTLTILNSSAVRTEVRSLRPLPGGPGPATNILKPYLQQKESISGLTQGKANPASRISHNTAALALLQFYFIFFFLPLL